MARVFRARCVRLTQLALLLLLVGCTQFLKFDTTAYQNTVQLKFETLALIDKSGDKYAAHQTEVQTLLAKYDSAADEASKVPNNDAVVQAWQIIRGVQAGSAGEFFQFWKQRGALRPAIRADKKTQITRHFDYVICLEAAKAGGPACDSPLSTSPAPAAVQPKSG